MEQNCQETCSVCNNIYSNKKSLLKHRRAVHGIYCVTKERRKNETTDCYKCSYCDKEYKIPQSRWQHEKKCKIEKEKKDEQMLVLKEENEELRNELVKNEMYKTKQKEEIIKLQKKLLSSKRLDTKTFKSLNKLLMERSMVNSNNTITNNTINNNYHQHIVAVGNEDLLNVLTMQQKQQILNCRLNSLEKLVEITHCGEMNQFKNIIVTNLKDNYAYRYDASKGYFVAVPKNSMLDNLVMLRVTDIEAIYDELKAANKIDAKTKMIIQNFLDKMENEDTPVFENDTKYENYKSFKIDNIKILLYNNQDKVTKNIALLISDNDVSENVLSTPSINLS